MNNLTNFSRSSDLFLFFENGIIFYKFLNFHPPVRYRAEIILRLRNVILLTIFEFSLRGGHASGSRTITS